MRIEEIANLLDNQPFIPFRLYLTDGSNYEIRHPEFILLTRYVIGIGILSNGHGRITDSIVRISPLHIVKIETLQPA